MSTRYTFRNGCLTEHIAQCDCVSCLDLWAEWMERVRALDRLVLADVELRQARPATDAEWAAFLEREFPRVQGGAPCS